MLSEDIKTQENYCKYILRWGLKRRDYILLLFPSTDSCDELGKQTDCSQWPDISSVPLNFYS
jgi:hypothetical protein